MSCPKKKQCTPVTSANLDNISKQIVHEKKIAILAIK
jgi:hypothetical protein